jgi:hypothetical protein
MRQCRHRGILLNTFYTFDNRKVAPCLTRLTVGMSTALVAIERKAIMRSQKTSQRGFRAWPENEERLVFAEGIGLNVSEVINEVLREHLKKAIETKTKKMREQLAVPVP